jgi:hypothetical protein
MVLEPFGAQVESRSRSLEHIDRRFHEWMPVINVQGLMNRALDVPSVRMMVRV